MSILITNIQRFSLHDGPGIRTAVFLKGCSLRCPWCSNPENLRAHPEPYEKDGVRGTYGRFYTASALLRELVKDKPYYTGKTENWNIKTAEEIGLLPGGVTFSGGECLLQMEELIPVCEALHDEHIHIAAETCLFVPPQLLDAAISRIDLFYCDVKILDEAACERTERGSLPLFLSNFDRLLSSGRPVIIRIPVIGTYTDTPENRKAVKELLGKYRDRILKIELIKEHSLGESKYRSLGMQPDYHGVGDSLMETYRDELSDLQIPAEICRI